MAWCPNCKGISLETQEHSALLDKRFGVLRSSWPYTLISVSSYNAIQVVIVVKHIIPLYTFCYYILSESAELSPSTWHGHFRTSNDGTWHHPGAGGNCKTLPNYGCYISLSSRRVHFHSKHLHMMFSLNCNIKLNVYYNSMPSHCTSVLLDSFSLGNEKANTT